MNIQIVSTYTAKPKVIDLSYDDEKSNKFIIFDTETICMGIRLAATVCYE